MALYTAGSLLSNGRDVISKERKTNKKFYLSKCEHAVSIKQCIGCLKATKAGHSNTLV